MTSRDLKVRSVPRVDIRGAFVRRTNLTGAILRGADLSNADATGASFRGADFAGARLRGTILRGADLTGARNLTVQQLADAEIDDATVLPSDISRAEITEMRTSPQSRSQV